MIWRENGCLDYAFINPIKELEMPKMKTKSSAKKRFKLTASGKVKSGQAKTSHMMMNKPKSMKRKARRTMVMFVADAEKVIKNFMPYGRAKRQKPPAKKVEGGK
jgi:large subunit ribosomal protein L35